MEIEISKRYFGILISNCSSKYYSLGGLWISYQQYFSSFHQYCGLFHRNYHVVDEMEIYGQMRFVTKENNFTKFAKIKQKADC